MITVAIDGPSGAGKSSVADKLAELLGIFHVNTGEIYRAIGVYLYENNIDAYSEEEVSKVLDNINIKVEFINRHQYNYLNGECVNQKLHNPTIDDYSSRSSALKCVREKIKETQRDIAKEYSVIMEGRDITTEILPDAKYKFFLTASPEVRALRRQKELEKKGQKVSFKKVLEDILERDYRDTHRELCPLKLADDAIYVDSDNYSLDEVVAIMYSKIDERE